VLAVVLLLFNAPWPTMIAGAISGGLVYFAALHALAPDLLPGIRELAFARSRGGGS
jgi:hypothetical protein